MLKKKLSEMYDSELQEILAVILSNTGYKGDLNASFRFDVFYTNIREKKDETVGNE